MKPVRFKEVNITYNVWHPDFPTVPAWTSDDGNGLIVSCWRMSLGERLRVLLTGTIWTFTIARNEWPQPLRLFTRRILPQQCGSWWFK